MWRKVLPTCLHSSVNEDTMVHDSHVTMTRGQRRDKSQHAEDSWVKRWKSLGPCWLGWAAQLIQGLLNLWIKDPSSLSHWSSSSLLLPDKINQTKRQEGFEGFVIKRNLSFTPKVLAWETEQKMLVIEIKLQHRKLVCARPRVHVGGRAG